LTSICSATSLRFYLLGDIMSAFAARNDRGLFANKNLAAASASFIPPPTD
jgi:hypothetical protein